MNYHELMIFSQNVWKNKTLTDIILEIRKVNKVFIQASSLAYEVYVEVSPLRSLPTTVYEI